MILEIDELPTGRTGTFDDGFQRTYMRTIRVRTNNESYGPIQVAFATVGGRAVPRLFEQYVSWLTGEVDVLALCRRVVPRQLDDDPYLWHVECEYSTRTFEPGAVLGTPGPNGGIGEGARPGAGGTADDPTARPPEISWTSEAIQAPLIREWDEDFLTRKKVFNTAGMPYDNAPTLEFSAKTYNVKRIEAVMDAGLDQLREFAVNSEPFMFADPGQAQLLPITSNLVWIGGVAYWERSYSIRFVPIVLETWQPQILNVGYFEYAGTPLKYRRILDPFTHQPVTEPWPLGAKDQFGAVLALTSEQIANGETLYTTHRGYYAFDFNELNLPIVGWTP